MRCVHYTDTAPYSWRQCDKPATVLMFAPDGGRVPGGYYCQEHGEAPVREYAEKMGETWTLLPIDDSGNLLPTTEG